jgi:uncharacterized protein YbaR (Trm112 family)/2-polyprenyl-3-methyl-5-hydroxy-6-metoxy-1,4-benzoquinol methylase
MPKNGLLHHTKGEKMKKWLADKLICPECTDEEISLELHVKKTQEDDVIEGELLCAACKRQYPIADGIAVVLPQASMAIIETSNGYNSRSMLSSYLWSHYCDFFEDPDSTEAYQVWSSHFKADGGDALDIGCAVGRLSFELSKTHSHAIGIDTSISFIQKARELLNARRLDFDLIVEGHICENRTSSLDESWNYDNTEFLVADALALPFPASRFTTVTSINILEKVPLPLKHLKDINRVLRKENSMFVFSDPFSWDEQVTKTEHWIGGSSNGYKFSGRGIDNMHRLFKGADGIFDPPLQIAGEGKVSWKIRKTENLWEHITSQFLIGNRN